MREHIEQTLDSREVAEMVEKSHNKLLRDLRRYEEQFTEAKIGFSDFFRKSEYKDSTGRVLPCYRITKKGCEFIAHKLTGTKGTIFTARYINRFHEMQDILSEKEVKPELPWFIKKFRERYIVLWQDFSEITGLDIEKYKFRNWKRMVPGVDFNGWGWKCNNDEFKKKYGFDYGIDPCMMYFYLQGVIKVFQLISEEKKIRLNPGSYEMLTEGIYIVQKSEKKEALSKDSSSKVMPNEKIEDLPITTKSLPIYINIALEQKIF